MDKNSPLETSKGYNDEDGVSLVDKLELNSFKSREECGVDGLNPDSKVPPDETVVYIRKGYVSPSMPLCETNEEEPQYALAGSNLADSSLSVTKVEVMEPKMLDYHIERPGSPNRDNEKQEHKVDFNTNVKNSAEVKDLNHRHKISDKGDADHYNSTDRGCFGEPNMKSSTPDDAGNCKYDQDSIDSLPEGIEVNEEMDVENLNQKHGYQRQMRGDDSSGMATPENGRMVWENSSLKSPQETHNVSLSPERRLSISAERSHHNQSPPKGHTSPKKGMPSTAKFESSLAPSPQSSKRRRSPSPEKRTFSHKRASSQDRSSPSKRLRSPSERASKREAHHRVDSPRRRVSRSPPRHDSPRRRGRSSSKSPTRRRGSPGHQRDHRHSRSPITRNRNRRSPRRQSPRRRSPPTYSSRHRSSRRPWSPPPNRNTGLGRPGKNLFIAGFSYGTTERDLERKFSKFGRVTDVRIVRDTRSGDSRGFGFLSLERDEEADAAIRAVDQTEWNGRIVLVEKSKSTR